LCDRHRPVTPGRHTQSDKQTGRLGLARQASTTSAEYTSDVVYFEWRLMETGRREGKEMEENA